MQCNPKTEKALAINFCLQVSLFFFSIINRMLLFFCLRAFSYFPAVTGTLYWSNLLFCKVLIGHISSPSQQPLEDHNVLASKHGFTPLTQHTLSFHTHWRWANLWNGTAHAELQGMNAPPGQESVWCIYLAGMSKKHLHGNISLYVDFIIQC